MKRFLLRFFMILFPWLALLIQKKPFHAIIAFFLQLTVIGWILAVILTFKTVKQEVV